MEIVSNVVFGVSPSIGFIWFNLHGFNQGFVLLCCRCSDALERVIMLAKKETWFWATCIGGIGEFSVWLS